jgi:hypothetical protein
MWTNKLDWSKVGAPTFAPGEDLMNRRDAAKFLGMSEPRFTRCLRAGHLPAGIRMGNITMYSRTAIAEFVWTRVQEAQK